MYGVSRVVNETSGVKNRWKECVEELHRSEDGELSESHVVEEEETLERQREKDIGP